MISGSSIINAVNRKEKELTEDAITLIKLHYSIWSLKKEHSLPNFVTKVCNQFNNLNM